MHQVEQIVQKIFSCPTAPYREGWVLEAVRKELKRIRCPFVEDSHGNIIAGISLLSQLKKLRGPLVLMAHTDHPGFHLVKKLKGRCWQARWLGGCPPRVKGALVRIYNPEHPGKTVQAVIQSGKVHGARHKNLVLKLKPHQEFELLLNSKCFGAFDFLGYRRRGNRILTRAADDLAGVAIILASLAQAKKQKGPRLVGVFTRAEEVGFIGALGLIYKKPFGSDAKVISLEASRQLPEARVGKGPVIRLGDRALVFDSWIIASMDRAAAEVKKRHPSFRFQRRILGGGTCEATAMNAHGIPAAGIAVPLGNYHNQRSNGRPGAEYIDLRDVEGAVRLCVHLRKNMGTTNPKQALNRKLKKSFTLAQRLLKQRVSFEGIEK